MSKVQERWEKHAEKALVGRKIVGVRYLSPDEAMKLDWGSRPIVFELDNGSLFYPSMDDEGNDGGALFGQSKDGKDLSLPVIRSY